jgi:alanine-synthesizing transaminase
VFSIRSELGREKNRLELARLQALRAGRVLLDLTQSNPTCAGLPRLERAIAALSQPAAHRYDPEPFGSLAAREALSAFMGTQGVAVAAENILLTASTSEAYAFLFKLLCDPGDQVLVPAPSYPLFEHLAQLESVQVASYPLDYDGRWHVSAHALASARGPRTRAVIAVHPNNPTGSYLKRDELAQLAALDLPIISDEVFAPYALGPDPNRVASALLAEDSLVFTLHGLSKFAGLPQLKLSWVCMGGPVAVVEQARARLEIIADSFLSVSTPVQVALPTILESHAPMTTAIRMRVAHNLNALRERTAGSAASLLHVEGGWYATLRLPDLLDDEGWALDFLQAADVLVQPGYFYGFGAGQYVVLSLLTEEAAFAEGIARVAQRVDRVVGDGNQL